MSKCYCGSVTSSESEKHSWSKLFLLWSVSPPKENKIKFFMREFDDSLNYSNLSNVWNCKGISGYLPEKWRHFSFSKIFLCFRVRVIFRGRKRVRVEVKVRVIAEIRLNMFAVKSPFRQVFYIRSHDIAIRGIDFKGLMRSNFLLILLESVQRIMSPQ